MTEWIKCSDRLPNDGQRIIGVSGYSGGAWVEYFDKDEPLGYMIAWKPYEENYDENIQTLLSVINILSNKSILQKSDIELCIDYLEDIIRNLGGD